MHRTLPPGPKGSVHRERDSSCGAVGGWGKLVQCFLHPRHSFHPAWLAKASGGRGYFGWQCRDISSTEDLKCRGICIMCPEYQGSGGGWLGAGDTIRVDRAFAGQWRAGGSVVMAHGGGCAGSERRKEGSGTNTAEGSALPSLPGLPHRPPLPLARPLVKGMFVWCADLIHCVRIALCYWGVSSTPYSLPRRLLPVALLLQPTRNEHAQL